MIYEPDPGDPWPFCACGSPLTLRLSVHYRYPRTEYEPMAVDPWFVHGSPGRDILTCGDPKCEPDALLAIREHIIDHHLRTYTWIPLQEAGAHMAGLELLVTSTFEDGVRILGGEDEGAGA